MPSHTRSHQPLAMCLTWSYVVPASHVHSHPDDHFCFHRSRLQHLGLRSTLESNNRLELWRFFLLSLLQSTASTVRDTTCTSLLCLPGPHLKCVHQVTVSASLQPLCRLLVCQATHLAFHRVFALVAESTSKACLLAPRGCVNLLCEICWPSMLAMNSLTPLLVKFPYHQVLVSSYSRFSLLRSVIRALHALSTDGDSLQQIVSVYPALVQSFMSMAEIERSTSTCQSRSHTCSGWVAWLSTVFGQGDVCDTRKNFGCFGFDLGLGGVYQYPQ
jgi:hypothetical protein